MHRLPSSICQRRLLILNTNGAVLVSGLMIMAALTILGIAAMKTTTSEHTISGNHLAATRAKYAAEAGLKHAIARFQAQADQVTDQIKLEDLGVPIAKPEQANLSDRFGYWINSLTYEPSNPPTYVDIESFGAVMGSRARARAVVRLAYSPPPVIDYGVFGDTHVDMGGTSLVDSYNSCEAPYDPDNPGTNVDVGTNGTGDGAIYVGPTADILGDVAVGTGGDPLMDINLKGTIDGDQTALAEPKVLYPMHDNGGGTAETADLSGGVKTLSGGDEGAAYRLPYIKLASDASLLITGDVKLYVDGDVNISGTANITVAEGASLTLYISGDMDLGGGAVVNLTENPRQLTIYGTETMQQAKVHGNADFYGTLYAPSAEIVLTGTTDFYGAAMGKSLEVGSRLHFDECLKQPGRAGSDITFRAVFWEIGLAD